jgi:hypothetical protein
MIASRPLATAAAVMALLVAAARVYVGIHQPVDVIVGPRAEARGARRHAPASPAMSVVITHYNTRI